MGKYLYPAFSKEKKQEIIFKLRRVCWKKNYDLTPLSRETGLSIGALRSLKRRSGIKTGSEYNREEQEKINRAMDLIRSGATKIEVANALGYEGKNPWDSMRCNKYAFILKEYEYYRSSMKNALKKDWEGGMPNEELIKKYSHLWARRTILYYLPNYHNFCKEKRMRSTNRPGRT